MPRVYPRWKGYGVMNELTEYEYTVTLVTDYSTITTGVSLWLSDTQDNLSPEAREAAIRDALIAIKNELGITGELQYCDANVKLIHLTGEEDL